MTAKLRAARTVTSVGGALVLAGGKTASIAAILRGEVDGTVFKPSGDRLDQRKRWIAHTLKEMAPSTSTLALLAPHRAGQEPPTRRVIGCDGSFVEGDPIVVKHQGQPIAKGLSNYSSEQIRRIMGKQTSEIASLLGGKIFDEVLHRQPGAPVARGSFDLAADAPSLTNGRYSYLLPLARLRERGLG